jgi:hypothetical protein
MKYPAVCQTCINEWLKEGLSSDEIVNRLGASHMTLISPTLHEGTCPNGHTTRYWSSVHLYDLLYQKAIVNLAQRDMRSAVANFYSAWENFVGHTVNLLLKESGAPEECLSSVQRAEPLLGAYMALFAAKTKKSPKKIKDDTTRIRNKILHSDLIPSDREALKVGIEVQALIRDVRNELHPLHYNYSFGPEAEDRMEKEIQKSGLNGVSPMWFNSWIDYDLEKKVSEIQIEIDTSKNKDKEQ